MKTICAEPGCNALTDRARCVVHKKTTPKAVRPFYVSRQWQSLRKAYLWEHPLCNRHLQWGMSVPANTVDHIIPFRDVEALSLDWENLQSLCHSCHSKKTWVEQGLEFPKPDPHRVFICGLPGAGKTTAAQATGYPVYDADERPLDTWQAIQQDRTRWLAEHSSFACIVTSTLTAMKLAAEYAAGLRHVACNEIERFKRLEERGRNIHQCPHGVRMRNKPKCCSHLWSD